MSNLLSGLSRSKSFQTLIDFAEHATDGIAFIDLNGTICFANASWTKMHSYSSPNDLIEKNICLFHTPAQMRTRVLPLLECVKKEGCLEVTVEHLRADGSAFEALTKIIALNDTAGQHLGFIVFAAHPAEHKYPEQSPDKLSRINKQLQVQVVRMRQTEVSLREQISRLKDENDELRNQIPGRGAVDKRQEDSIPIREIPPFDAKKLSALADLAKRLAKKSDAPIALKSTSTS